MTDTMSVADEFEVLTREHEGKTIREAVTQAKDLVERAKKETKSRSWRRALERLVGQHGRCLPRTLGDAVWKRLEVSDP